jgi:hypothetical protein
MKSLEDRARMAYRRRFGENAPIPSVNVDDVPGIIELYNVNGVLGVYRITKRGLRWDKRLAAKLEHAYESVLQGRTGKSDTRRVKRAQRGRISE